MYRRLYGTTEGRNVVLNPVPSQNVEAESAMVATVEQNSRAFTRREIDRARSARELMARMGFPSVAMVMSIVNT